MSSIDNEFGDYSSIVSTQDFDPSGRSQEQWLLPENFEYDFNKGPEQFYDIDVVHRNEMEKSATKKRKKA